MLWTITRVASFIVILIVVQGAAQGQLTILQHYTFDGGNLDSIVGDLNTATIGGTASATGDAISTNEGGGGGYVDMPWTPNMSTSWKFSFDINATSGVAVDKTIYDLYNSAAKSAGSDPRFLLDCDGGGTSCSNNSGLFTFLGTTGFAGHRIPKHGINPFGAGNINVSLEYDSATGDFTSIVGGDTQTANIVGHTNVQMTNLRLGKPINWLNPITAIFDNVIIEGVGTPGTPDPPATTFTWTQDGVGDWSEQDNWTFDGTAPAGVPANNPNHTAIFGDSITTSTTVVTNAAVTLNRIEFENTTNGYVVGGHGSVNMAATTAAQSVNPTMSVQGTHQFQGIVNLHNSTTVDVASGSALSFNNILNLNGTLLTKTGDGEIAINNILTASGGTLNCDEGICSGSGTIGGDLNNLGGTISPGNSSVMLSDGNAAVVPEPTSFLLAVMCAVAGFALRWRKI